MAAHQPDPGRHGRVTGVQVRTPAGLREIPARAVVIACGRLRGESGVAHALPRARTGTSPSVRGTRHNTGEGIRDGAGHRRPGLRPLVVLPRGGVGPQTRRPSATAASATCSRSTPTRSGSSSTCTASASWTRARTSATTPTPSTGARSCASRSEAAFQIFDQKTVEILREEYRIREVTKARGRHHRGARAEARDRTRRGSARTVREFNAAVRTRRVQPRRPRRPRHARDHPAQVQLGAAPSTPRPTWASR